MLEFHVNLNTLEYWVGLCLFLVIGVSILYKALSSIQLAEKKEIDDLLYLLEETKKLHACAKDKHTVVLTKKEKWIDEAEVVFQEERRVTAKIYDEKFLVYERFHLVSLAKIKKQRRLDMFCSIVKDLQLQNLNIH
jgi:hypothetical protein